MPETKKISKNYKKIDGVKNKICTINAIK